jgi:RNA polymerase sigma factor (TIGR02999 family)
MSDATDELVPLLDAYREGRPGALEALIPLIYADLRNIARRSLRQWNQLTLDTTGLVHETYLKMSTQAKLSAQDRSHLLAICARAMRQFVIGHVRNRMAAKRGAGAAVVGLEDLQLGIESQAEQLVFLDDALQKLAAIDENLVRVFECRYFAGMTDEETAAALSRPLRSVQRDWMRARAWIRELYEAA